MDKKLLKEWTSKPEWKALETDLTIKYILFGKEFGDAYLKSLDN